MSKSTLSIALATTVFVLAAPSPSIAQQSDDLLLTGATVIDGTGEPAVTNGWIWLRGNKIHAVGQGEPPGVANGEVLTLEGKTVIPGLADMHVHLRHLENARWMLKAFLAHGITVVTETGNSLGNIAAIRDWIAVEEAVPHYYASSPSLQGDASNLQFLKPGEEVERAVSNYASFGVDFIKTYNFLSTRGLAQTVEIASRHEIPVIGHTPLSGSSVTAFNAGMKIMQHLRLRPYEVLDDPGLVANYPIDELLMKRTAFWAHFDPAGRNVGRTLDLWQERKDEIFVTPTLVTQEAAASFYDYPEPSSQFEGKLGVDFMSDRMLSSWTDRYPPGERWGDLSPEEVAEAQESVNGMAIFVGLAHDRGIRILSGSDAPVPWVVPGVSLHRELQHFVEKSGMSPEQAIQTSTGHAAAALGTADRGTIEEGKIADLVIVDGNLVEDIRALANVETVILGGRHYSPAELMEEVRQWAAKDQVVQDQDADLE